jgi:hypothetical protein
MRVAFLVRVLGEDKIFGINVCIQTCAEGGLDKIYYWRNTYNI